MTFLCGTCGIEGGYHDEADVVMCAGCGDVYCWNHIKEANVHAREKHGARFLSTWCTDCGIESSHAFHVRKGPFDPSAMYVHTCGRCKQGVCEQCGVYAGGDGRGAWYHTSLCQLSYPGWKVGTKHA